MSIGLAAGEIVELGLGVDSGEADGVGDGVGKAKVGETIGVGDSLGEGVAVGLSEGVGLGVGVGVGMRLAQRYNGVLAPPSSWTSFSQRACIFSKSGGPNGVSAVPGKIR